MIKTVIMTGAAMLASVAGYAASGRITVNVADASGIDREELVEIDAAEVRHRFGSEFIVRDSSGKELPWQFTHDGLLVFPVSVRGGSTSTYTLESGTPAPADTICFGQFVPECQDDFSWENDRSGYRLYGPSYRSGGGVVRGYDIWTKSVPWPVIADRYYDDHQRGISYHIDHGNGMDAYTVGPTLGAGTNALVRDDGTWALPWCYEKYEILDNGPLRMTARLTCYPEEIDGDTVVETRLITLDKGSWLNRTEIEYKGLEKPRDMVAGIVVHKQNPRGYTLGDDGKFVSYADLTDNPSSGNGVIYVGVLCPSAGREASYRSMPPAGDAEGHVFVTTRVSPGTPLVYYWGSGWSRGGVGSCRQWDKYIRQMRERLHSPLIVSTTF